MFHLSFSFTGLEGRHLSLNEIGSVWGLPIHLKFAVSKIDQLTFPPFHALIEIIQHMENVWLQNKSNNSLNSIPSCKIVSKSDKEYYFLPDLNKKLPHAWLKVTIDKDSVVKADNAEANIDLWNKIITPLFPSFKSILPTLRLVLLKRQRKRTIFELLNWLRKKHGNWETKYKQKDINMHGMGGGEEKAKEASVSEGACCNINVLVDVRAGR